MHEMQKTRPWAILTAGAAIQVLTGLPAAWGVFQRPVMEEYGLSEQGAGYAFGVLIAFFGIGCVIGGFLQDKQGPRFAALWGTGLLCGGFFAAAALPAEKGSAFFGVFSIPAGLGTAFLYPSIQSCAQKPWHRHVKQESPLHLPPASTGILESFRPLSPPCGHSPERLYDTG